MHWPTLGILDVFVQRALWNLHITDYRNAKQRSHPTVGKTHPMWILGIVFLYSAVKHLLSWICHSLAGNTWKGGVWTLGAEYCWGWSRQGGLRYFQGRKPGLEEQWWQCFEPYWGELGNPLQPEDSVKIIIAVVNDLSSCFGHCGHCGHISCFSPVGEGPAAKNSGCPGSSVADRSWSNSSSGWTGFPQRSPAGFGRKLRWHFSVEDCQYSGRLEDLSSAAGCWCALASPACPSTSQDLK